MAAPALTVCGIAIPWETQTLEGFRAWVATLDEHGPRVSYSRGSVHVEASPQDYDTHEPLVDAINAALRALASELDLGRYCFPPSWFTHKAIDLSTEPDGFLALWSTLERGELRINPDREVEMIGRPDMVLEVVSESSQRKDLVEHVEDYARAHVSEYWIADARRTVQLRVLVLTDGAYVDAPIDGDGWVRSPVFGRAFRLRALPERAGFRDFALDVQA